MGAVCSELLQRVVNQEAFDKRQSGPTLRRLFGAYRNADFWAVYRRFRAIDDGNGYVSYEELLQCVSLAEYQLLFIWESFSQQNELIHSRELMTVICIFSSAPLMEKGKFLQALFDDSHTGLNTATELVSALHMVLAVLTKCTGIPVKVKEVREQVKSILPDLLPSWADALERCHGKSEVAFNTDRFIGQIEMEQLLPSLSATYEALPIAGPAPPGAMQPPPPDWAVPTNLEKGVPKAQETKTKTGNGQSVKALSKAELAHLDWMTQMDEEESEGKENLGNARRALHVEEDTAASPQVRSSAWLVIYSHDFATVAKNLASFRHLFMRSVATALGLPMGCIEVVNVQRGNGSVVLEFLLLPSGRGSDTRDSETLKQALAQQLSLPHSALRKGPFKDYVQGAELLGRPQDGDGAATAPVPIRPTTPFAAEMPTPLPSPSANAPRAGESSADALRDQDALAELRAQAAEAKVAEGAALLLQHEEELKRLRLAAEGSHSEAEFLKQQVDQLRREKQEAIDDGQAKLAEVTAARDAALKELSEIRASASVSMSVDCA